MASRLMANTRLAVLVLSAFCAVAGAADTDLGVPAEPFRTPYLPTRRAKSFRKSPRPRIPRF